MMLESQSSALTVSPIPPQNTISRYHAFFKFFVKVCAAAPAPKLALALALI